ncbi:hypothetical protein EG329_010035 [Mollisiaceae sp. DMI_Dod_QoI]|nr:hypothetical protein EG329_010035 [Helotiales sp. DMI_Dod_QoI]
MPAKTSSPKKERLTLAQLAAYDDILTDALVDHVYFWTTIRKNKSAYHSSRGIREEDVTKILQNRVIVKKDPAKAETELLALSGLRKFSDSLKTEKEKEDFRKHLRKYINIYLPDCPFEVSSTNRYTIVTQEAAVTARRFIKKGEIVKYLCGIQVIMTEEEEELIKSSRRDFSIVVSSRNKTASLFLGPARFANHDCGASARLMTTGTNGMEIIAVRDIEIGDEITVSYGENYFGEDNCECLCQTCEEQCLNGWSKGEGIETKTIPKLSIEESSEGYSFRRRRRRDSIDSSRNASMTPDITIRPHVPKRTPRSLSRFKNQDSPMSPSVELEPTQSQTPQKEKRQDEAPSMASPKKEIIEPVEPQTSQNRKREDASPSPASPKEAMEPSQSQTPLKRKRDEEVSPSPSGSAKRARKDSIVKKESSHLNMSTLACTEPAPESSSCESRGVSLSPSGTDNQTSTDATSVDEDTIVVEPYVNPVVSKLRRSRRGSRRTLLEQAKAGDPVLVGGSTTNEHPVLRDDSSSVLSDVPSETFDHDESTTGKRHKKTTIEVKPKQPKSAKRKRKAVAPRSDLDYAPTVRVPGDYVLTPLLLVDLASAWITCKICQESFVQNDAYFTRSSCPRCERHSKLYGYMWPKTDKEGRDDSEERVLDHRTVHRFIRPVEEKLARKRNRSVTESRDMTREVSEVVVEKEDNRRGGRRAKKPRITM